MTVQTVFVVEDEESFVDALTVGLKREGFRVEIARDGAEALARFDEVRPDIVLLDVMLPKVSGIDVCREIRKRSQVPIIMVTAKSAEIDTVVGLEVGADDYITKPYRMRELVARMRAVLRRTPNDRSTDLPVGGLTVGDVSLDPEQHVVVVRGVSVSLPLKEFELLRLLLANAGRVLSREQIIEVVRGREMEAYDRSIDVHIGRIRAAIERDVKAPKRILTVRGVGYVFSRVQD